MHPISRVAVAVILALAAGAQEAPRVSEAIDVSIVNLDVVVIDRQGKRVSGLTAADFDVREEGKPQEITNFSEYHIGTLAQVEAAPAPDAPTTAPAATPREKRVLVLFLEKSPLLPEQTTRFFAELKSLVHSTVSEGDAVAVVAWTFAMDVRQNFTSDLGAVDKALDQLEREFKVPTADPNSDYVRNLNMAAALEAASVEQEGPIVTSKVLEGHEGARRSFLSIRRKVAALESLVNTMAAVEGRKILLMSMHRFSEYAGAEFFGGELPLQYREDYHTRHLRDELAAAANAAGVTIYTMFPQGAGRITVASVEETPRFNLRGPSKAIENIGRSDLTLLNETAPITELAKATGGAAAWGPKDIVRLVTEVRQDLETYYSIAFRATAASGRRKLSVRVKNPAYTVRVRGEHVEKDEPMLMRDRVVTALYQDALQFGLPFDVQVGEITTPDRNRLRIPLKIRIPENGLALTSTDAGRSGAVRVFGVAGGRLGVAGDVFEKEQRFTLPAAPDPSKSLAYDLELVTDPAADRIVIGVLDESSRQWGLARITITRKK